MLDRNINHCSSTPHFTEPRWTKAQQRLLNTLQQEDNRQLLLKDLWEKAEVSQYAWYQAIKDPNFFQIVEALGVKVGRVDRPSVSHIDVTLASNPEEEMSKDVWDMRRLKSDYPKHKHPSDFKIDFSWIANPVLRQQVKHYFRLQLALWKPLTFKNSLSYMRYFLQWLPAGTHVGILDRQQVETILLKINQLSLDAACRCLQKMKAMLDYMAISPSWTGPRPPRGLIWNDDIPSEPDRLPRPIPPDVLDQLDALLENAVKTMKDDQTPPILTPMLWDALLILRRTGMRAEDLAHLKTPDELGRDGCIDQDSDGYWWIRLHHNISKMSQDHRIPTRMSDGVIDAVRRQQARITGIPDHFGEHYLFRRQQGVLTYDAITQALRRLAAVLLHQGQRYRIVPHQFRHSLATDMIEMGVDIYTVKEFLGHKTLAMTERYIKVYLTSLKAKYDAYRVKKQQTYATEMIASKIQVAQQESDTDGGWVENKVGKLYVSPLPDGIGNCVHLPMHDGCPDSPHCPTCPKLHANKRHLPVWENKAKSLLITVEALRTNPAYARARQKHEQELRHAEKVITTINEEGFWDGRIHNGQANTH